MKAHIGFYRVLYLIAVVLSVVSTQVLASGVRHVSEDYLMKTFSHVCVLDVVSVNTEDNLQVFTNGTSRRTSSTLTMMAVPKTSLKGECGEKPFTSVFTTPVTVSFNDDGTIAKRYTIIKTETGVEMHVNVGQEYIVWFDNWQQGDLVQRHSRVNLMADLKRVVSLSQ